MCKMDIIDFTTDTTCCSMRLMLVRSIGEDVQLVSDKKIIAIQHIKRLKEILNCLWLF